MPGCIVSATTASLNSVEKRRLRATPMITSTFENVSDIGVCLGLSLGPPGYRTCPVEPGCTPLTLEQYVALCDATYPKMTRKTQMANRLYSSLDESRRSGHWDPRR